MALKTHHLRPAPGASTAKIRIGHGEAFKGKTAGHDTKGTGARKSVPANFEGGQMSMHTQIPKLKGFKNPSRMEYQVVNVGRLAELFPRGGAITMENLVEAGAVRGGALVKALGDGDINVTLNVTTDTFSNSAKEKLAAVGGSVVEA